MITARLHDAQERQSPIPASQEWSGLQKPNNEQNEALQPHAVRGQFASVLHRWQRLWHSVLQGSKLHHINGDGANGLSSVTVDEVASYLSAFANGVVASLTFRSRLMTALSTVSKAGHYCESLRHGLHAGNQGCGIGAHGKSSVFGEDNMRNNVPNCKRYFT